jgi:hypothetical protein
MLPKREYINLVEVENEGAALLATSRKGQKSEVRLIIRRIRFRAKLGRSVVS